MTHKLTLSTLAVCILAAGGCVQATRNFNFTHPWGDYERVVVRTANGRVRLTCGNGDQLSVAGRTRERRTALPGAEADREQIQVVAEPDRQQPRTLLVDVHVPDSLKHAWLGTDLEIGLPAACAADIATSNAPIYVADAKDCVLATSNGLIDVERINGKVEACTSNGRVKALCVAGDLAARSSNGAIQVENVQGACRLTTSNAPIKVLAPGGNVDATTANGPIRFEGMGAERADTGAAIKLHTSNGPISMLLPRQLAGELTCITSHAHIHAGLHDINANIRQQSDDELRATLGGGGPASVTAETSDGPIRVDFR